MNDFLLHYLNLSNVLLVILAVAVFAYEKQRRKLNAAKSEAVTQSKVLNNILKGTNVGTWEWNVQTGETRFNERWAQMIGYTLKEISPTSIETWMKFANPDDLKDSEAALQKHFDGEAEFYELEARMKHKDGHWIWVLDRGRVSTYTPDGKPEWMFGTHQEITRRKRLEEELIARTAEAESALKVKSDFLAAMSHEIRTPMSGVLGLAYLALKEKDEDKKTTYLQGIQRSGKLLLGILNDILDLARLEAGRTRLQLENFNPTELLTESLELFRPSAESKGLELSLSIRESVPAQLYGDPIKLAQMVNNYLGNAIKFTPSGSIKLSLSSEVEQGNHRLRFECKDTGIGIAEKDIEQLFIPFSQVSSDSRIKASGTGLGLVLVAEYAKLMGGHYGVKSEPGRGSVFWFDALLEQAKPDDNGAEIATQSHTPNPCELAGTHVLIAEDNQLNVMILQAMLDEYLITYEVATNGAEALEAYQISIQPNAKPFDLILMDVHMPVMDGLEATEKIKSHLHQTPPIVGLTAAVMPDEIENFKAKGMDAVLAKPIDTTALFTELLNRTQGA